MININVRHPVSTNRKCDLPDCHKEKFLWNVFLGCGHSFHIECALPEINVCPICRSSLFQKAADLSQTANNFVFVPQIVDETDDQSDHDDDEDELRDCEQNEAVKIDNLLEKISL